MGSQRRRPFPACNEETSAEARGTDGGRIVELIVNEQLQGHRHRGRGALGLQRSGQCECQLLGVRSHGWVGDN